MNGTTETHTEPIADDVVDAEVEPRSPVVVYTYDRKVETRSVVVDFSAIVDAGTDILLDDLRRVIAAAEHLPGDSTATFNNDGRQVHRLVIEHRTVTS